MLERDSERYGARRMRAATYLSQHRFADALREAERCRARRADDAWVWGVLGEAHIERREYDEAFDAFDRMAAIKPTAAAYARVSYARELQGDLLTKLGQPEAAERQYRLAEARAPTLRRRRVSHAFSPNTAVVSMRRLQSVRRRASIADALAWAYFQTVQIDKARTMIGLALRTRTRDRVIRAHAAEIARASKHSVRLEPDQRTSQQVRQ